MAYRDFSIQTVRSRLGVRVAPRELFAPDLRAEVPDWLPAALARGASWARITEKARSELIVVPILQAAQEVSGTRFSVLSGERLDVDPEVGLNGVCDFLFTPQPPDEDPILIAPVFTAVEAKRGDIALGMGQCIAQMVGAARYNAAEKVQAPVYGCVTSGTEWQFLKLGEGVAYRHSRLLISDDLPGLLGVFRALVGDAIGAAAVGPVPPGM